MDIYLLLLKHFIYQHFIYYFYYIILLIYNMLSYINTINPIKFQ
jgi:hypothetical protein